MPICPRCGKCLSSDQALTYHLNRKYRCGTWKCAKCNDIFNTKFHLQMHELNCIKEKDSTPTVEYLLNMYNNLPFLVLNVDKNNIILNASPNIETILNKKINDVRNTDLYSLELKDNTNFKVIYEDNNERILMLTNQ